MRLKSLFNDKVLDEMHVAVRKNDVVRLRALLSEHARKFSQSSYASAELLCIAISVAQTGANLIMSTADAERIVMSQCAVFDALMEAGAAVNAAGAAMYPVHAAAQAVHPYFLEKVLAGGADPRIPMGIFGTARDLIMKRMAKRPPEHRAKDLAFLALLDAAGG